MGYNKEDMAGKNKKAKKTKKQVPKAKPLEMALVAQSIEDSLAEQVAPYLKQQADLHEMLRPHIKIMSEVADMANRFAVEQQRAIEPHLSMIKAAQEARKKMQEQVESILKQIQIPQIMDEQKTFIVGPRQLAPAAIDEPALSRRIAEEVTGKIFDRMEISSTQSELSVTKISLKNQPMELLLTKDGDLYRDPKNKYCYELRAAKSRLKIIQLLTHDYTIRAAAP